MGNFAYSFQRKFWTELSCNWCPAFFHNIFSALLELFWNQMTTGKWMEIVCITFSWFTVSELRWSQKLCGLTICQGLSIIYLIENNCELPNIKGDWELIELLSVWKAGKYNTSGFCQSPWYAEHSCLHSH